MPKIVKPVSSPNNLWHRQEVDFKFGESSRSAEDNAARNELKELQSRTNEQRVRGWLKYMEDRARQVFADHGLPVEPGVYFEPNNGTREYVPGSAANRVPPEEILARAEAGEGEIIVWPNFQRIDKLTPPEFARTVLNFSHDLISELEHEPDPWRATRIALELLHPYHCMVTEDSDLGKLAVSGVRVKKGRHASAKRKTNDREKRLSIVLKVGNEYRAMPGHQKATAHEIAQNKTVLQTLRHRLAAAGLPMIREDTIGKILKKLGF